MLPAASAVCALCDPSPGFSLRSTPLTLGYYLFIDFDRFGHLTPVLLKNHAVPLRIFGTYLKLRVLNMSARSRLPPILASPIIPLC